jgi:hypothetical protein
MSHISKIDLAIKDLDAFMAAVKRCSPDLEFVEGQETYRWYGKFVGDSPIPAGMKTEDYGKCLHAVRVRPDAPHPWYSSEAAKVADIPKVADTPEFTRPYELGIVKIEGQAGYTLVYDNWNSGRGLEKLIGQGAARLKAAYATEVTVRTMRRQGYRVREETVADGSVRITCTKPGAR